MIKDIKGYEGEYAITEEGKIWSYKTNKFLQTYNNGYGYYIVSLCQNGVRKNHQVHRLVLATFNPVEGMEKLQVNHIDEDKANNNLSNLEWTTAKENTQYSIYKRKGKKTGKVIPIEQYTLAGELVAVYPSQAEAARQTEVNRYCISDCVRGRKHSAGGYIWRYQGGARKQS